MTELRKLLTDIPTEPSREVDDVYQDVKDAILLSGYKIAEENQEKPWGAYLRMASPQADQFVTDFFPGLTAHQARLGMKGAELSPKVLLVKPGERLSWQYHLRRAERWRFLTAGGYHKSRSDDEGELVEASAGDVVQFVAQERHRLVGAAVTYSLVAEIWQHTDPLKPSDEDDIVRLQDDYAR